MPSSARFAAIQKANSRKPRIDERLRDERGIPLAVSDFFGTNTFSLSVMANKLPRADYKRMVACVRDGAKLERDLADAVAHAAKEWAIENGCTHFTHWFQPMTGSTAEKHDAFLTFDKQGKAIERFSGDMLLQSEPDASSFPSGGTRSTFEARGYTAWDPSSPMFIMESENGATLCIPSAFVSYTGEALDKKTPLMRSMEAINRASARLYEALGLEPCRVTPTLGCEQEYFLVDRAYWAVRPDLAIGGRTVVGANPPKGQSLDDHYFGSVSPRVMAFMAEVEHELYKLGVPAKTRHNEVAPSQFEIAPIFREANVAVDHNQLVMEILRRVAVRHDYKVLLAEKPFADINGSGKHNNWSLQDANGDNLLEPGDDPGDNLRFLAVLASVLLGVFRHGGLLRASVASYGNDFRLGANEAPPAVMSVFVGELLTRVCDALASGEVHTTNAKQAMIELGVSSLPHVAKDNTDRNRTSPVAFTGNKFEFRAVGSQQNPAWPMTVLNLIVADAMTQIADWVAEAGGGDDAVLVAVQRAVRESSPVRFEGNGYSDEWLAEAESRGLKNLRKTPEALEELRAGSTVGLFERFGVLTPAELNSRYNVLSEQYVGAVTIDADLLKVIVDEMVLPAAAAERAEIAAGLASLASLKDRGIPVDLEDETTRLTRIGGLIRTLCERRDRLVSLLGEDSEEASYFSGHVAPHLEAIRETVDELEAVVADHRWPMPKYREMLFLV